MSEHYLLTREKLQDMVNHGLVNTVVAVFPDLYGRLLGKRFDVEYFLESTIDHGTHACNYLLTVDMEMEPVSGYQFANWDRGYGDFHLAPDLKTLRTASWLEQTAIVLCDVTSESLHELLPVAPRSLLKSQIEQLGELGYTAQTASELEYYLFENTYKSLGREGFHQLQPSSWYIEDYHMLQGTRDEPYNQEFREALKFSAIPVESSKGEWGCGQQELNIRYADILEMADRHILLKQCAKELANKLECSVTFMAKPSDRMAGSSCHVHLSLWDKENTNVFVGTDTLSSMRCSDTFRWFLGGWIAHAAEFMVFYAPNVNSYKRFRAGSWAPTMLAWSPDNRTAGFRIVGTGPSLRIECRIPGADCNPYLTYAAMLASGMDGIRNQIEPPAAFNGNAYKADSGQLPADLKTATELFASSEFVHQVLGEDVAEHYAHFFRTEQTAYDQAVTDWELKRYFERI
jgi:glutamine synthetase